MDGEFSPTKLPFGGFQSRKELADYLIYGVPLDVSASFRKGCEEGPSKLRIANSNIESISPFSKIDLANLLIHDLGDLIITDNDTASVLGKLGEITKIARKKKLFPFAIGGEHTITAGIAEGLPRSTLVIIDAHLDLRYEYNENKFSHACAISRAYEKGDFDNVVFVGTRAVTREEIEFAKENEFIVLWSHDLVRMTASEFRNTLLAILDSKDPIYLSIDMDGIDPGFAPGVGNPEANGLWPWHVLELIKIVAGRLIGADMTEYNPKYDCSLSTGVLAARIAQTILVEHFASKTL